MEQSFTAKDVQRLRQMTGAGMLDCKEALSATAGDVDAAARRLREQGKAALAKRSDRQAEQGVVALVIEADGARAAALVELRCETDFVAKSSDLVVLADDLAALVAAKGEEAIAERQADVDKLAAVLKENVSVGRVVRFAASEGSSLDGYLHIQNDRGVNGVLVELEGGSPQLAHDVAVHIAFARPAYLSVQDVPEAEVEAEREMLTTMSLNEGKPEAALAKIVEGRLRSWFKERCLLEQPYVRDEKQTVAQMLGSARVLRFAQIVVGS